MKKRVIRISVLQAGKCIAVLYSLMAVIMFPVTMIMGASNPGGEFMVLTLLLYPVMGFVSGIIMAALYNLSCRWTGGLEVTTADV